MNRIDSVNNEKIKYAVKLSSSSKKRKEEGLFFLEGLRLCRDAALTGTEIAVAFFTDRAAEKSGESVEFISSKAKESYLISEAAASKISLTESSQGFYALCKIPGAISEKDIDPKGKYIALENIQDPANLGAISRTAEALGISGAILSGCCDRFSPKAQRAAMGSLLRLKVIESENLKETLLALKEKGMAVYATTPDEKAKKITDLSFDEGAICIIGNEGDGVSAEIFEISKKITIPMLGRAESLNASMAAAITMWEMMR